MVIVAVEVGLAMIAVIAVAPSKVALGIIALLEARSSSSAEVIGQ